MLHHRADQEFSFRTGIHWQLLSFIAGCVNTGGFLACERFVSHVTGFATLFGIEAARARFDAAIGILSVPVFFLLGVITSGWLVDRRIHSGKRPHYVTVMSLVAACLILAASLGALGWFGEFGTALKLKSDYFLLALLCLASGLQNASITTASGASVRTTHLTGVTTDLGLSLVRILTPGMDPKHAEKERRSNRLRVGKIAAFAAGSAVSAVVYGRFHYLGFLLPAGIVIYLVGVARGESRRLNEALRAGERMSH